MSAALSALRARKEERRRLLEGELERISRQIQEMGALKIVVFGSLAAGNIRSSSDLDLLAVMPPIMTGRQWMGKIYEMIDRQVDSDILAFTEEELKRALPQSRFLRHILATGKVIYQKATGELRPCAGSDRPKRCLRMLPFSRITAGFTSHCSSASKARKRL